MMTANEELTPWVTSWGADPWSWNLVEYDHLGDEHDGSGMPGRGLAGAALARWCQSVPTGSAAEAAALFNLPVALVSEVMRSDLFVPGALSDAIQVWSICVGRPCSINLAATVFAVRPAEIMIAVMSHQWMYLETREGDLTIGHEGE